MVFRLDRSFRQDYPFTGPTVGAESDENPPRHISINV
jgi:hypothetical protein